MLGYKVGWGKTAWAMIVVFLLAAVPVLEQYINEGTFPTGPVVLAAVSAGALAVMQTVIFAVKALDPAIPPEWFPGKGEAVVEPAPPEDNVDPEVPDEPLPPLEGQPVPPGE